MSSSESIRPLTLLASLIVLLVLTPPSPCDSSSIRLEQFHRALTRMRREVYRYRGNEPLATTHDDADIECYFKCGRDLGGKYRLAKCSIKCDEKDVVSSALMNDSACCTPYDSKKPRHEKERGGDDGLLKECRQDHLWIGVGLCRVFSSYASTRTVVDPRDERFNSNYTTREFKQNATICFPWRKTRRDNGSLGIKMKCWRCNNGFQRVKTQDMPQESKYAVIQDTKSTDCQLDFTTSSGEKQNGTRIAHNTCRCFESQLHRHRSDEKWMLCGQCRSGVFVLFKSRDDAWKSSSTSPCGFAKYFF